MKSAMPFHGVGAGPLRSVCREVFDGLALPDAGIWRRLVLELWDGALFREERYAAIELTGVRAARPFQDMRTLPLYEQLVVEGAWWDYVDAIAAHRLGTILRQEPGPMRRAMLAWARGDNLWKRRSAILCQLRLKDQTDMELLRACIEPSMGSREFFLRKAIGWALRQLAWSRPDEVVSYVRQHEDRLSPLSRREALKHVADGSGRTARTRPGH